MTNDLEAELGEIIKYFGDNGYHENRGARIDCGICKNFDEVKAELLALIEAREIEARISELNGFRDWIDEMHNEPIVFQFANRIKALQTSKGDLYEQYGK